MEVLEAGGSTNHVVQFRMPGTVAVVAAVTGHPAVVTGCGEECKEARAKVPRGLVRVRGTDGGALGGRGGYHDMPHHNHHNNGGGRGYRQQSDHDQNNHLHNYQGG